jgi:oligopeptidase A
LTWAGVLRVHSPKAVAVNTEANPLLEDRDLPPYTKINPEHVRPAVETRLKEGASKVAAYEETLKKRLASSKEPVPYDDFYPALEELSEFVGYPWSVVDNLKAVRDDPAIRKITEELQPKVTAFGRA